MLVRSGGTIKNIFEELIEALNRGCRVRIILCSRDKSTIEKMAFRGYRTTDPKKIRQELESSIDLIKSLKEKINLSQRISLEVRDIQYVPPIGISMTDPELPSGKLFALLVSFRSHSRSGPSIKLQKISHSELFDYFKNEFENYWEASNEIPELKI